MYIFIIIKLWILLIRCVRVCFRITSMAGTETNRDVKGTYTYKRNMNYPRKICSFSI